MNIVDTITGRSNTPNLSVLPGSMCPLSWWFNVFPFDYMGKIYCVWYCPHFRSSLSLQTVQLLGFTKATVFLVQSGGFSSPQFSIFCRVDFIERMVSYWAGFFYHIPSLSLLYAEDIIHIFASRVMWYFHRVLHLSFPISVSICNFLLSFFTIFPYIIASFAVNLFLFQSGQLGGTLLAYDSQSERLGPNQLEHERRCP